MKPTNNYGLSDSLIDTVRKSVEEALIGGQKKLDVDKDGKLEKSDFASLRAKKDTIDTKPKLKEDEQIDESHPTAQQVKQAIGIARDKRYAGGNMTGAVNAMRKLHPYLPKHPAVAAELRKQNEEISPLTTKPKLKEEEQMDEAAHVKTNKYSWGTMKTVHQGSSFSIPLHPEHHEAIAKLKDQQEHKFKDETGHHWTAKRQGDDVHFQGANGGNSTKVPHKAIAESKLHPNQQKLDVHESLDSIAKKHGMKYTTTAYGAGMKHPTKGEISINRYGEWHHKGTNKTGDSENDFSSLDKHLSTVKEAEQMDEVKLADLPIRTVKGTSYGADYKDPEGADDAWEKERFPKKRKSGPQGTMKRRFGTKSYEKIKGKLKAQYK
jgi:hypothetical protein